MRRMAYVRLGFQFGNEFVYKTSLQCMYPTLSERSLKVVITSYSNVRILNVGLTLCERQLNVVITSYSNASLNVVTTFLQVHKKTLTQRQSRRCLDVRRTLIQRC